MTLPCDESLSPARRRAGGFGRAVDSVAIAAKLNCVVLADFLDGSAASTGALVGGAESPKISYLVKPLVERGLKVRLVTLSTEVSEPITVSGPRVTLTVCPSRSVGRGRDFFAAERRQVRDALLAARADVVHAHHTYEYALGALATGLPTLVTVRDWAPAVARLRAGVMLRSPKQGYQLISKVGMQFTVLARSNFLTANSPYLAGRAQRLARGRIAIVPNCLPPDVLTRRRRQLKTPPTLVAVNRDFSPLKNTTTLLEAFSVVRRRLDGARLVLVGPGYESDGPAAAWATVRGLADGVEFMGSLPNDRVLGLFDSADLLAHPSREESFGIVLIEAMARGTPVVGGRQSGAVPWVLGEGKAGVLANIDDPQALAATIYTILNDPSRWHSLSEAGREHVRKHFSAPVVARLYAREYEHVLANADPSTSRLRRFVYPDH